METGFYHRTWSNLSHCLKSIPRGIGIPISKKDVRLLALKDVLQDKRAFIAGNGPSLKIEHLNRISGEVSFAANLIFRSFPLTSWRPSYYVLSDAVVAENYNQDIVNQIPSTLLLADYVTDHFPPLGRIVAFRKNSEKFENREPAFSSNALRIIYGGYTVTYLMLQLAWWMGVREFYLLGVDCKWNFDDYQVDSRSGDRFQKAEVLKSTSHFIKDYFKPGEKCIHPSHIREQVLSLTAAKKFIEGHGGKIFNAAHDSPLEVFERRDFNSLF
jgi:hypothetical protein